MPLEARALFKLKFQTTLPKLGLICRGALQDDTRMLTASGDQSVGVWDTQLARLISVGGGSKGHGGSVKTVSYHPRQAHVFASSE